MARGRRNDRSGPGSPARTQARDTGGGSGKHEARPAYEDIEFDESDETDQAVGKPPAVAADMGPALRTEDHAMSQPGNPHEDRASGADATLANDPPSAAARAAPAAPPPRRGGSGFFAGLIGGLLGSAALLAGAGWYAYEHGPVRPTLARLEASETAARDAEGGIAGLGEQIGALRADLDGLRGATESATASVQQLGQQVSAIEERVAANEQATSELDATVEQASTSFRVASEEVIGRLEAVNARLAEVARAQPADVVDKGTVEAVAAKQAAIEEAQARLDGGLARLEQLVAQGLEAGNQQAAALRVVVDSNRSQLDEIANGVRDLLALRSQLEQQQAVDAEQRAALQAASERVTSVRNEIEQRLEEVTGRLSALDEQRERSVGMALAVDSLETAIQTGQPFGSALDLLTQLGRNDEVATQAVNQLQPSAESGVPTVAELAQQLRELESTLSPPEPNQPQDWLARTRANLQGLVDLHPADEEAVPGQNAVRSASEALLLQDLEGAVSALEPLAAQGNAQAAAWVEAARARLEARAAVETLRQHVKTLLARQD